MPDGQWVCWGSGGLVVHPARHVIELIVDVSDAFDDIGAEMVDHLLVLCFALCVFLEHAEKQVNVKRCPDALLQRDFDDRLYGCIQLCFLLSQ